ncbi:MAG: hypothetical protein U0797_28030 [Gemmataceae bacterium]
MATLRSLPGEAPKTERSALRWTGADTLTIEVPLDGGEMTLSTVEVPGYDPVPMPPVCIPYSPEFRPSQNDRGLATLEKLGRATGGQERLDLPGIWRDLPRHVRFIPIARWLLLAAVVLWLLEVFERRTSLLTSWRSARREEPAEEPDPRPAARPRTLPSLPQPKATKAPAPASKPAAKPAAIAPPPASAPLPADADADGIMEALRKARKRAKGRTE